MTLSIVDQSPVRQGGAGAEALRESIELAVLAERCGYRRFWVAEHHSHAGLAATSPAILAGQIAARTSRIRVGSGGVLLPNYSPLQVAENFRVLESLYPGRIDLGLGRSSGGDMRATMALAHAPRGGYAEQVERLLAYLADDAASCGGVRAGPTGGPMPEVWLLGSGVESAQVAAERGLAFSFAHFFTNGVSQGPAILEQYRRRFRPSPWLAAPRVNVAVSALCAETAEEAERLASSMWAMRLDETPGPVPPPQRGFPRPSQQADVVGDPEQVRAGLDEIAARYGTDDLSLVTICHDFAARARSYELIAARYSR